jgi:hypothetical protein
MREQIERLSGKLEAQSRAIRLWELEQGLLNKYIQLPMDTSVLDVPGAGGARILKAPRNLKYEHQIFCILLTWDNVEEEYSHVEIWCAENSVSLDDAKKVGIATKPMAEWRYHGVSMRVNYTFWIRAVGWDGGLSPWCPPQGQGGLIVPAEISKSIEEILEMMIGQITENQLYQALNERIALIDGTAPGSVSARIAEERTERISGDSTLAQSITTLQSTTNDGAALLQIHASVIDGLKAQYFVKTDVNGYMSGFGLYNTGQTSDFIVLANRFMIVTPGQSPKVPFVVGPVGTSGAYGVGIDGSMVVNGTIMTRHLDAGSVTADKIGADQVSGQHIAATSDITLNEGGRLTVGQNNIILDSATDSLVIAPDNGTVIGQANLAGVDYCKLAEGDIDFMYWNSATGKHQIYNTLKRIEVGFNIQNNTQVTIPGIWKNPPKIMVSPASIMSYNKNYVANQTLECSAENLVASGLTYRFTPVARLRLTDGVTITPISLSKGVSDTQYYSFHSIDIGANTTTLSTPDLTTAVTVSGTIGGSSIFSLRRETDGDFTYYSSGTHGIATGYIYIDGMKYLIGSWSVSGGPHSFAFSKTVTGLTSGVHTYYLRIELVHTHEWILGDLTGYTGIANVNATGISTNQSTHAVLADGTLNYMAIGE